MTDRANSAVSAEDTRRLYDEFVDALSREHAALSELDAFSAGQRTLIEAGDADTLLDRLDARQRLVDAVTAGWPTLERLRAAWSAATASPERRDDIRRRLVEVDALLARVRARDTQDAAALASARDAVAAELSGVAQSRRALAAYGPATTKAARYQDGQA